MVPNTSNSTYDALLRLNDEKAVTLIPVIFLCASFILMGLVGNSLVCYVMGFRFKSNNHNLLIVWLAIFDLFSCILTMPRGIIEARYMYSFPSAAVCKIFRFVSALTNLGSIFVLAIIAIDRYKKICAPLSSQMSLDNIKAALIISSTAAAFIASPASVIYGFHTFESPVKGQMAQVCFTADEMMDTAFPLLYTGALFTVFLIVSVILITMYGLIWLSMKRHERKMITTSNAYGTKARYSSIESALKLSIEAVGLLPIKEVTKIAPEISCDQSHLRKISPEKNTFANISPIKLQCKDNKKSDFQIEVEDNETERGLLKEENLRAREEDVKGKLTGNRSESHSSPEILARLKDHEDSITSNLSANSYTPVTVSKIYNGDASENNLQPGNQNKVSETTNEVHFNGYSAFFSQRSSNNAKDLASNDINNPKRLPSQKHTQLSSSRRNKKLHQLRNKATRIAFLVTLVYILSFLPYLCLRVTRNIIKGFEHDLEGASLLLYNIILRSYYINSIANPIIYGAFNIRFRNELKILFCKLFCCRNADVKRTRINVRS